MVTRFIRKYPLISFFSLAYLISWALGFPATFIHDWPELITFMTDFGPVIAAILVVGLTEGENGVWSLLSPLLKWRVNPQWYLIVLLGPAFMMFSTIYLYHLTRKGDSISDIHRLFSFAGDHIFALLLIFVYQIIIVWGEEIGWRGYALPRLQSNFHPILASVILGILWGFWHLPDFWIEGSVHQSMSVPFFVFASIGYSILYTWIFNGTRGSLLLISLFHAANNTTVSYTMLIFKPIIEEPGFSLVILGLFTLLVIVISGPTLFWHPLMNIEQQK